jgi:diguanylate cyclase (GGDEF)-like protein
MLIDDKRAWVVRSIGYEFLGDSLIKEISHISFELAKTPILRKIVTSKKPVIINDVFNEPEWYTTISGKNFQSWIGVPVLIDHKVAMIFSLDKKEPNFYKSKHAEQLIAFCSEAALAIQNARLYESGTKRIQELESLQSVLKDISSQLDVQLLLHDIMERALSLLGSSSGVLGLYQEDIKAFKIVTSVKGGNDLTGNIVTTTEGLMGEVARTRKPITVDNYTTHPKMLEKYQAAFPYAVLEVPLLAGEKLIGVLAIGAGDPLRKYSEDDIRLLSLFAQQATIALTNARLFTDAQQRAEEAETLRQAGAIVASTLKQKQALHLILAQLAKVVPYDSASILLSKGDELELVDGNGTEELPTPIGMRIRLDQKQPGVQVFRDKKSLIVNHMRKEFPSFFEINQGDIRSWLGVPLIYKNRTLGILSLDSLVEDRYTENHAHLASAFANQVAVALENVRMYEDALKSAKRFATLYTLSQRISLNLQPKEIYQAIHKAAQELMRVDSFILSLYDPMEKIITDVYFIDHGIQQNSNSRPLGEGLFSQVIRENRPLLFDSFDEKKLAETHAIVMGDEKDSTLVKSAIIVPLRTGQQINGILSVQSYQASVFTEEDKETLEMLATQSAIALENTRLFNEIQELAMTDSLTKIYNRRKFFELADIEYERASRYKRPLSAIMMDIDLFKNVNDTYGHAAGDVVLRKIAEVCQQTIRSVDILARYGGEEFVVILPETTPSEAGLTAERLRQTVARTPMKIGDLEVHNITLSFGVVGLDSNCKNIEELLDRSDQALYVSKNNGRNRVSIWSPTMQLDAETKPTDIKP